MSDACSQRDCIIALSKVMKRSNKYFYSAVTLITVIAILLRYHYSLTQDLWIDEAMVLEIVQENDWKQLALVEHWDKSHPPLLYFYTKALLNFFSNDNKIALRALSLVFGGLATIPLMYYLKKTTSSLAVSFVGGILFAINPTVTVNSFSLRPYGVAIFLFLVFLVVTRKFDFNREPKLLSWQLIFINFLIVLSFFWDYSTIWFIIPFGVLLIFKVKNIEKIIAWFWLSILCLITWMPIFIGNFSEISLLNSYANNTSLFDFLNGIFGLNFLTHLNQSQSFYIIYGSYIAITIGLLCLLFIQKNKTILLYALLPILVAVSFSFFYNKIICSKTLYHVSGFHSHGHFDTGNKQKNFATLSSTLIHIFVLYLKL